MTNEEAIEILQRYSSIPNEGEDFEHIIEAYDMAIETLKNERPQGEWMKIEAPSYTIIRCTCCGYKDNAIYIPNYCPNCGADMREADNENISR